MAMAGTVSLFNAERGYGFIKPDEGGRDVLHVTAVEQAGLKSLDEGQRISFDVEPDKGKDQRPSILSSPVSVRSELSIRAMSDKDPALMEWRAGSHGGIPLVLKIGRSSRHGRHWRRRPFPFAKAHN